MEMSGEVRIPAARDTVWAGLNDAEVLKQCIPGCESIERESDTRLSADMKAAVGPVKAKFSTHITLSNVNPPVSYTISGEGKGGAAGFARGEADVRLEEQGAETLLKYTARLRVGGKLAQVGSRLVDGVARKTADDFFKRFAEVVAPQEAEEAPDSSADAGGPAAAGPASGEGPGQREKSGRSYLVWLVAIPILLAIALWIANH